MVQMHHPVGCCSPQSATTGDKYEQLFQLMESKSQVTFHESNKDTTTQRIHHGLVFDMEVVLRQEVHTNQLGFSSQSTPKFQGIAKG